jgi:hypothetical protein
VHGLTGRRKRREFRQKESECALALLSSLHLSLFFPFDTLRPGAARALACPPGPLGTFAPLTVLSRRHTRFFLVCAQALRAFLFLLRHIDTMLTALLRWLLIFGALYVVVAR